MSTTICARVWRVIAISPSAQRRAPVLAMHWRSLGPPRSETLQCGTIGYSSLHCWTRAGRTSPAHARQMHSVYARLCGDIQHLQRIHDRDLMKGRSAIRSSVRTELSGGHKHCLYSTTGRVDLHALLFSAFDIRAHCPHDLREQLWRQLLIDALDRIRGGADLLTVSLHHCDCPLKFDRFPCKECVFRRVAGCERGGDVVGRSGHARYMRLHGLAERMGRRRAAQCAFPPIHMHSKRGTPGWWKMGSYGRTCLAAQRAHASAELTKMHALAPSQKWNERRTFTRPAHLHTRKNMCTINCQKIREIVQRNFARAARARE